MSTDEDTEEKRFTHFRPTDEELEEVSPEIADEGDALSTGQGGGPMRDPRVVRQISLAAAAMRDGCRSTIGSSPVSQEYLKVLDEAESKPVPIVQEHPRTPEVAPKDHSGTPS